MSDLQASPNGRPSGDQYSIESTYLFARHTRATYYAATGVQAPPFKVNEPIKRWFQPIPLGKSGTDVYRYKYVDQQTGAIGTAETTYELAGRLNLPGASSYPKYVVEPTAAQFVPSDPRVPATALNPDYFSTAEEASDLAQELGCPAASEPVYPGGSINYPPPERRRNWHVQLVNGRLANVGMLLKEKYRAGVGAPGHWSSTDNPQWVAEVIVTVEANNLPEAPIPSRELYPDEVIARVFPGGIVVQRRALADSLQDKDLMPTRIRELHQKLVLQSGPVEMFLKT